MYLLSSLPHIDLKQTGEAVWSSFDRFLEDCDVLEDTSDEVIQAIVSPQKSDTNIAKLWAEYDYSIRNEIAKMRWSNIRSGTYHSVFVHGSIPISAEALDMVGQMHHESNHFLREKTIIEQKWMILDSLDASYQFKLENIIIYGWKLQLYFAYRNITEERGEKQWNTLLSTLADKSGFSINAINGGKNE